MTWAYLGWIETSILLAGLLGATFSSATKASPTQQIWLWFAFMNSLLVTSFGLWAIADQLLGR